MSTTYDSTLELSYTRLYADNMELAENVDYDSKLELSYTRLHADNMELAENVDYL